MKCGKCSLHLVLPNTNQHYCPILQHNVSSEDKCHAHTFKLLEIIADIIKTLKHRAHG